MSFADLVHSGHRRGVGVGAVHYVALADGPGSTRPCVQAGLYLVHEGGVPVAVLLRGVVEHGPDPSVRVEVLAADREQGERIVAELRRLCVKRSVFRNQVVTFATGPFGASEPRRPCGSSGSWWSG